MDVAARMTKIFWTPLSANQVLFAADNDQTRRQFQRMTMRTFYVPDASTPQDLNEIANILRILFDIRYITQQPSQNSLIVRAPQPVLDAAVSFLNGLSTAKPQVMLDIKAYEVSSSATRQVGVGMPTGFTVYNVPTELQKLLGNQSVQDIINQLIASGAINQANSSAIAALIAQGLNQQTSIFATPFLLFGGGTTLSAVTIPPVPIKFSVSKSDIRSVEHAILRGSQNTATTFKIGTRVPIINATFAPIYNTPEIAKVLGNQSYIPPVPSFQFEDIGLSLKATPQIREKDVTLNLELQVRALGPTALNGLPVISNREYKGVVSAQDGTTIVLAGMLSPSEQHGLTGIPLLGQIPVAGRLFATENKQENDTELLIVITPHIVSKADRAGEEIVMPANAPR
jgi:general secretion pathway protein D